MSLKPGMALQPIDIAIKACQELQGEPQIDDGRGWAFRPDFDSSRYILAVDRERGLLNYKPFSIFNLDT